MSSRQPSANVARARRKEGERAAGYGNLKSMGLKAGVLAVVAGLALYPKITGEANVVEREIKNKADKKIAFRRRERRVIDDVPDSRREREREDFRRRESVRGGERTRGGEDRVMRVDEYDMRKGEGFSHRDEKRWGELRMMRRASVEDQRRRNERERDRRWEQASARSAGGSDRTKEWVTGGYEYLSGNEYRERDRKRW